jgi:ATP-dependent Clp protease ATP-binding subunit ClpA
MFERFTEESIKVIMLAQEESRRLGHNYVGTEQLLLGIVGEGTGIGAKVLKSMGVTLKAARKEVQLLTGRGSGFVAIEIPFTPRAKRVLELSLEEARQLGHNYMGTEHLLLGLVGVGGGIANRVFDRLDVAVSDIRNQVIRMLGESSEYSRDPIDAEDDEWYTSDVLVEDNDFVTERGRARRRDRLEDRDPLETAEIKIMLRSILDRTSAIERSVNEMRSEIIALSERLASIEDKL